MTIDKATIQKLRLYSQVFREAAERGANESDTVMYLVKFFEEVLGYDSLTGEISKEVTVKDRYCDFAVKLGGTVRFLVEAKAVGNRALRDKDIEQAGNYGARSGIHWVLLTNGIEWRLYHLSFAEGEGIGHDLAFSVNLGDCIGENAEQTWALLGLLAKGSISRNALDEFWNQKKALAPASLVRVLFSEPVLSVIRREINRTSEGRLEMEDVFAGVKDVLSKDALLEVGEIAVPRKRKKRRKMKKVDAATGKTVEVLDDVDEGEQSDAAPPPATASPTSTPESSQSPSL